MFQLCQMGDLKGHNRGNGGKGKFREITAEFLDSGSPIDLKQDD